MKDETIEKLRHLDANEQQELKVMFSDNIPDLFSDRIKIQIADLIQRAYEKGIKYAETRDLIITNSEKTFMKR